MSNSVESSGWSAVKSLQVPEIYFCENNMGVYRKEK